MTFLSEQATDYLTPLRALNEYVYCPRLFHLMYVQGIFVESVDTVEGKINHQKRMTKTKAAQVAVKQDVEQVTDEAPWPQDQVRAMTLGSRRRGIIGKLDVLIEGQNRVVPVEVKHGPAPDGKAPFQIGPYELRAEAWPNDQLQLAGQIAILQEAGYVCNVGRIYYQQSRSLVEIDFDDTLSSALDWVIGQTHKAVERPMPDPLIDSNKCIRCSLNYICLPDETNCLKGKYDAPRQLYPGRDDEGILHLTTPGTQVGKRGETLYVTVPDERPITIPMKDIAHICCWGNVQITSQAILAIVERGAGITWLSGGGWLRATAGAPLEKNVLLRRAQYQKCDQPDVCLYLSKQIVRAKIENQRVLLRRNSKRKFQSILQGLRDLRDQVEHAEDVASLRGIEGYAAKQYWSVFPKLINEKHHDWAVMHGRNRRPPLDPINALLSFGYSMLLRDFMTALHGAGLDPLYGFYHAVVPGRPALALDLMEAYRPLVVDSAVLRAINEGSIDQGAFVIGKGFCIMKPHGKKRWIKAYERRVDELVTHPLFGYRLSYRRLFSLEARLLGRYFIDELDAYQPLVTR